jgi:hypothetical protein
MMINDITLIMYQETNAEMILLKNKNQLDATYYFIVLLIGSSCLRALLCPSSRARDYDVDYHIGRSVLGLL